MIVKLLRDHLPWVAPSAALVFFATGYFDKQASNEQIAQAPATVAYDINAQAVAAELPVRAASSSNVVDPLGDASGVVTRLSMVTDSSLQALQPEPQVEAAPAVVAAVDITPTVQTPIEPVAKPVETAALEAAESSTNFFAEAQANLAAQESCIADLRAISEQTRVYFPAGGLTLDESGISQARLLATLGQNCNGIQIIVEGHSDPSGNAAVNQRLSQKRAEQVIQRLGASGLDTSFFVAQGMGSDKPSGIQGPEGSAYYDRRVEFVVLKTEKPNLSSNRFKASPDAWASSSCVTQLQNAVSEAQIFYAPRSVAAKQNDMNLALELASMAQACPDARLRVIGQHTKDLRAGENPATGRLRATAMMAMLVGQGIDAGQIIIAAPSRSLESESVTGSRLDFDIILE